MKTFTKLLLQNFRMIITITMVLLIVISCKKKADDTPSPSPAPGPVPTPPATPATFMKKSLHLISPYELSVKMSFPANSFHKLGKGLKGEDDPIVPNPLKKIGKNLWDIHDYIHTEHEFRTIDNALNSLTSQIDSLQGMVVAMGKLLSIQISELQNFIASGDVNTQIGYLKPQWGMTALTGFNWYSETAANWEANPSDPNLTTQMNNASSNTYSYSNGIITNTSSTSMTNIISQLNEDLCPTTGSSANALSSYANTLIPLVTGKVTDTAQAMSAYLLLESYFLQVINYQSQAATIYINAANVVDSTGVLGYDTAFWNGSFIPSITEEVSTFLQVVDYMVVNLSDCRTSSRFQSDMEYINAGLAPDLIYCNVVARAQFVANMIYDGLGLSYPVYGGYILTPWNYTNGNSSIVTSLTLSCTSMGAGGGTEQLQATANTIKSQIPYTYWVAGSTATCAPDNQWNVYRFTTNQLPSSMWAVPEFTIQVVDNGNLNTPWVHYTPIQGAAILLFYNPQNPSQTSTTKTSTCSIQFGYFSANWQWGFTYLSTGQGDYQKVGSYFDVDQFNSTFMDGQLYWLNPTPVAGTSSESMGYQNFSYQTNGLSFQGSNNTAGNLLLGGSTSYTGNYYCIADNFYHNLTTSGNLPPLSGNVQAWASYKAYYGMEGSGGSDLWVYIGLGITKTAYNSGAAVYTYTVQNNVVNAHINNSAGNWNSGFGSSGNLETNHTYQPGIQYYYQTHNIPSVQTANIQLITGQQYVYGGFYTFPPSK